MIVAHGGDWTATTVPYGSMGAVVAAYAHGVDAVKIPGSNQIYWLVNVGSTVSDIDVLLGTVKNPHAFMVEMDPSAQTSALVSSKLHPANVRAFTYDKSGTASVGELTALFDQGFDVVSANATTNNEAARVAVNNARSVSPP